MICNKSKYLFVIFFFTAITWSCKSKEDIKTNKYYIIIERTSKSLLTNRDEREDKIDSVFTVNDESAYDSCMAILYGMRVADSILLRESIKMDRKENYPYWSWKIKGYKIINEAGENIIYHLSDSIKRKIEQFWIKPNG